MNQTTGSVYDVNEVSRVKAWIAQQDAAFIDSEKSIGEKQWFVIGGIVIVGAVAVLLLAKKIL